MAKSTTYNKIADLIPVAEEIMVAANKSDFDGVESICKKLLDELTAQKSDPNVAVMFFNTVLCHIDGLKDKTAYDNVISRHSRVVRSFCATTRKGINMEADGISKIAAEHITDKPQFDALRLLGVRKTLRVTKNLGVLSPYLVDEEPVYATIAGGTWAAISTQQVLDAGFLYSYGNKFDILRSFSLMKLDKTIHTSPGITPEEFGHVCRVVIARCIDVYGSKATQKLVETALTRTLSQIPGKVGEKGLEKVKEYANQFCNINLNVKTDDSNNDEWLACLLSSRDGVFTGGTSIPKNATINFGMELLYPVAPLFSKEWINAVNDPKLVPGGFRIGFVDNTLLYHAYYDCSNGVKVRLLPYPACSFAIGNDQTGTEKISETSLSKILCSSYTWTLADVDSRTKYDFNLDEVLSGDYTLPKSGSYTLVPRMIPLSDAPSLGSGVKIEDYDEEEAIPSGIAPKDVIAVIRAKKQEDIPSWGTPLDKRTTDEIIKFLDFLPGQEYDDSQDVTMCVVSDKPVGSVGNAILSNKAYKYLLVKTNRPWGY